MKATVISITVAIVLIGSALVLARGGVSPADSIPANNVSVVDGKQVIEIRAKGGYQPRRSIAKAGIPTVIRFNTNGTFHQSVFRAWV